MSCQRNYKKLVSILLLLLLIMLLPIGHAYASNPNMPARPGYHVEVCENGMWKSIRKELISGRSGRAHFDGFLQFIPLREYVYSKKLPRITPSEDFSYRVVAGSPDVSVHYSYRIYDQNWERVLNGEETNPDLSGLDAGKYLLYISVYASIKGASEQSASLAWLIIGDYKESFVFELLEDGTYSLFEYCGTDVNVEIPSEYNGCPVTRVGKEAFEYNRTIKTVTIPDSVQVIEDSGFESCSSLKSVVLPDGIKEIGKRAFAYCESLEDISLPSTLTEIDQDAFSGCKALTGVVIPESVNTTQRDISGDCSSLLE